MHVRRSVGVQVCECVCVREIFFRKTNTSFPPSSSHRKNILLLFFFLPNCAGRSLLRKLLEKLPLYICTRECRPIYRCIAAPMSVFIKATKFDIIYVGRSRFAALSGSYIYIAACNNNHHYGRSGNVTSGRGQRNVRNRV